MNELDISLMLAMNFDGGAFMDAAMKFISGKLTWIPLYLGMLFVIYRRFGWKYMVWTLLFIAAGVGICDQVCNIFKSPMTPYLRPSHTESLIPQLHIPGGRSSRYGTVSAHAATSMCIAIFPALIVRKKWFTAVMMLYPLLVSYSRIYLGVHFPFQILFGLTLGALVGTGLWYLFKYLAKKFNWYIPPKAKENKQRH